MKKILRSKKGFTLVELMVVVAIMGILVAVAIPVYNNVTTRAEAGTCEANRRTIQSAFVQAEMAEDTRVVTRTDGVWAIAADVDVDALVTAGYFDVNSVPACPSGGTYDFSIDETTGVVTVTCSAAHN